MIYAVVDTETTGVDPRIHEVIEVAAVLFDRSERIIEEYRSYCSPSGLIPPDATAVNHITNEMVVDYPRFYVIRPKVIELIKKADVIVGHNLLYFDLPIMKIDIHPDRVYDTLLKCRERYPRRKHNLRRMCMFHKLKWDDTKAHGAMYDCIMTMKLFLELEYNKGLQQELLVDPSEDEDEIKIIAGGGIDFLSSIADEPEPSKIKDQPKSEPPKETARIIVDQTVPRLEGDTLIIPFSAPDKYQWQKGGQSVLKTLQELGASQEIMEKYCKTEMSFNERQK